MQAAAATLACSEKLAFFNGSILLLLDALVVLESKRDKKCKIYSFKASSLFHGDRPYSAQAPDIAAFT